MKRKEPTLSEDQIDGASSSSAFPQVGDYEGGTKKPKGNGYEVFLSFRGKDTRKGFSDYLYTSFVNANISVFRDNNDLHLGEEFGAELHHNITQSKILIPIISKNYAFSKWCLRELALMLDCKRIRRQVVLPIFYKVKPSQVRHLTGRLGNAIDAHKENSDKMVVKEWEEALKEVSFLTGWESKKIHDGYEGALVQTVVKEVLSKLKRTYRLIVPEDLVGIDDHVEKIMSFIDANSNDTRIIGIYGMGGIGKTTLAKVVYNNFSSCFEHLSFVANIRETSLRSGIECLQKQLIDGILRRPHDVSNVDEGISVMKSEFPSKKVLILLDDINDNAHLDALVGDNSWFKAGSIIIITTRDESILDKARASYKFLLNELPLEQSLILFSRRAFEKDFPRSDYEVISRDIVSTCGGLPLALEVIGSSLRNKGKEVWEDTLRKLSKVPHKGVQEKLMISYEALDDEKKQIFLDIACFFIGSHKQSPTYMWDACHFFPREGIEILSLMSLIKIDQNGHLSMHDQLRDLGRQIVRLENIREPHERSRLWDYDDVVGVLDRNKGTSKIEALRLDKGGLEIRFTGEQFKELTNLRFLHVKGANFVGDFQNSLHQLRWLWWEDCPLHVPTVNFHPKKLLVLNLSWNLISEDWRGWGLFKMATKLKVLNLTGCPFLTRTPDLSAFESLEILILEECWDLEEIHPSIEDIKTLVSLNVGRCRKLKELPAGLGRMEELRELLLDHTAIRDIPMSRGCLMKLETLRASYCEELIKLPGSMDYLVSLTQLDVSYTQIEELPESIGFLKKLETLDVSNCASLAHIPSSIGHITSLQRLLLQGCRLLKEIPDSIGNLVSLTELDLNFTATAELPVSIGCLQNLSILDIHGTHITELPGTISMLAKLQELSASGCENMEGIPSNVGELVSLNKIDLDESGIAGLPKSISKLSSLQNLSFRGCEKLRELPELPSGLTALGITCQSPALPHLFQLTLLKELTLSDCLWLERLPELPVGLAVLYIARCGKLKALTNLSTLKHLNELILDQCFELTEVLGLEGLQSLSSLHLLQCPKISRLYLRGLHIDERFPDSSKLMSPKVTQLEGSLDEIQGLSGSKLLQMSDISYCMAAGKFLDLSSSKYLRELQVTDCKSLTEIRDLNGLESLEVLDISGCTSLRLSLDLSNLRHLWRFSAEKCENLVEIRGLRGSEFLSYLDISGCTSLRQSLDLSNLRCLWKFCAANCKNLVEIRGLDGLESLRDLDIFGCTSLGQSLDLSNLRCLSNFHASNCENLVEIRGLDGLVSLRDLDISGCTSLRQSLDLSNLKNLRKFSAANCENLVEIRGLYGLESLMEMDISGCMSPEKSLDLSNHSENFNAGNLENLIQIECFDGSNL